MKVLLISSYDCHCQLTIKFDVGVQEGRKHRCPYKNIIKTTLGTPQLCSKVHISKTGYLPRESCYVEENVIDVIKNLVCAVCTHFSKPQFLISGFAPVI